MPMRMQHEESLDSRRLKVALYESPFQHNHFDIITMCPSYCGEGVCGACWLKGDGSLCEQCLMKHATVSNVTLPQ
jgi:hypothetical protein